MKKVVTFSRKRKYVMLRRIAALVPMISVLSIPLLKLINIFALRIEYSEALYANNSTLANEIYAERLALKGTFLYELPTLGKLAIFILLFLTITYCIYILTAPISKKRS